MKAVGLAVVATSSVLRCPTAAFPRHPAGGRTPGRATSLPLLWLCLKGESSDNKTLSLQLKYFIQSALCWHFSPPMKVLPMKLDWLTQLRKKINEGIWMEMHCFILLNVQKELVCCRRKDSIPLDLMNFWLWCEFHEHRRSYRICSYCDAEEGNVFVWGYGILGKGPNLTETAVPEMIPPSLFGWSDLNPDVRVAHVRCGLSQFAALTSKFLLLLSRESHVAILLAALKAKRSFFNHTGTQQEGQTACSQLAAWSLSIGTAVIELITM